MPIEGQGQGVATARTVRAVLVSSIKMRRRCVDLCESSSTDRWAPSPRPRTSTTSVPLSSLCDAFAWSSPPSPPPPSPPSAALRLVNEMSGDADAAGPGDGDGAAGPDMRFGAANVGATEGRITGSPAGTATSPARSSNESRRGRAGGAPEEAADTDVDRARGASASAFRWSCASASGSCEADACLAREAPPPPNRASSRTRSPARWFSWQTLVKLSIMSCNAARCAR